MDVRGQTALVTGANRGLGRAIAEALLQAGAAKVYAAARDPARVDLAGGTAVRLDITDPASAVAAAERYGDVSLLVNNAGIFTASPSLGAGSAEILRGQLETNLFGTWNVSNAFAPVLARNGGGAIVNVLSVLSWVTLPGTGPYSISKAAAWALSNGLRRELKPQGTQVLAVHVGYMDTDMAAAVDAPKTAPAEVAARIVAALQAGEAELLADDVSKAVKAGLGAAAAPYL